MKAKAILFALAGILLFSLASSVSAYAYYAPDNYDSYSYHSERTNGGMYGGTTRTNDYNRATYTTYLPGGGSERTTTYVRTTRELPNYGYGPVYHGGYYDDRYHGGYASRYNTPAYDYQPWYQNYWGGEYTYPRYTYRYSSRGY